ncbi:type VII secretion integral membrane protein EccD [Streptomyces sp. NPDC002851]
MPAPAAVPAVEGQEAADAVQESLDLRTWRWRPASRRPTAAVATLVLALVTAWLVRQEFAAGPAAYGLFAAALVLAVGGVVAAGPALPGRAAGASSNASAGRPSSAPAPIGLLTSPGRGNRGLATVLLLTSGGCAVLAAWTLADAHQLPGPGRLVVVAAAVALTLLLLGLFSPFGRAGLVGAVAVAVLTAVWQLAALLVGADPGRLGATLAVISVVLLGLLPRLALRATGLTAIDDRRSTGSSVSRHQVADALTDTHRGLVLATLLTAGSAAAAGLFLTRAEPTPWTVLLAALTGAVLLARARAFPLVVEVVALFAAAAFLLVRLTLRWLHHADAALPLAALALASALPLLALALRPGERARVRLRQLADGVESVGVVALFPLAVGAFGVYGRLFGGA